MRVRTLFARSARAAAEYYGQYLARDAHEIPGRWTGCQAPELDLIGDVSVDDLSDVLAGLDPRTGDPLGRPLLDRVTANGRRIPAVGGFDATFSAPKTLSIWWGLTGDERLAECHDIAVRPQRPPSSTTARPPGFDPTAVECTSTPTASPWPCSANRPVAPTTPSCTPRHHLLQGPDSRRPLVRTRRPDPQEAPTHLRRPLPVGPSRRTHRAVRRCVRRHRQRARRDSRLPAELVAQFSNEPPTSTLSWTYALAPSSTRSAGNRLASNELRSTRGVPRHPSAEDRPFPR